MRHKRDWKQAGIWFGALVVLMALVASHARASNECKLSASAAWYAAHIERPRPRNSQEYRFIAVSRHLLAQSRGDLIRFLTQYQKACEAGKAPRHVRVNGDRVVVGRPA